MVIISLLKLFVVCRNLPVYVRKNKNFQDGIIAFFDLTKHMDHVYICVDDACFCLTIILCFDVYITFMYVSINICM